MNLLAIESSRLLRGVLMCQELDQACGLLWRLNAHKDQVGVFLCLHQGFVCFPVAPIGFGCVQHHGLFTKQASKAFMVSCVRP